jgi:phosphocarrier protein
VEEKTVRIQNKLGLHARPAAEFVKLAGRFDSEIRVSKEGLEVNGKSIMGVLMLAAEKGTEITIQADGADADDALSALADLVNRGFEED